jgi:hypothetical protein
LARMAVFPTLRERQPWKLEVSGPLSLRPKWSGQVKAF